MRYFEKMALSPGNIGEAVYNRLGTISNLKGEDYNKEVRKLLSQYKNIKNMGLENPTGQGREFFRKMDTVLDPITTKYRSSNKTSGTYFPIDLHKTQTDVNSYLDSLAKKDKFKSTIRKTTSAVVGETPKKMSLGLKAGLIGGGILGGGYLLHRLTKPQERNWEPQ